MSRQLPTLAIRPDGREKLRKRCGAAFDRDIAAHIGVHPGQVSRVLSGKFSPGNRFIAGVIDRCGIKFAFTHVFELIPDQEES